MKKDDVSRQEHAKGWIDMNPFPFSEREVDIRRLVWRFGSSDSTWDFARRRAKDAIVFKAQYIELDRNLSSVFGTVAPANSNSRTFSVALATIIRNAANLFELCSRWLYRKIFDTPIESNLKIFHFLSLDKFTCTSQWSLSTSKFYDELSNEEVYKPFLSLSAWDKKSSISHAQVPKWWTASNKLKHSNDGLNQYGNLENAISAVGGVFVLLHAIFGPGYVFGNDVDAFGVVHEEPSSSIFIPSFSDEISAHALSQLALFGSGY